MQDNIAIKAAAIKLFSIGINIKLNTYLHKRCSTNSCLITTALVLNFTIRKRLTSFKLNNWSLACSSNSPNLICFRIRKHVPLKMLRMHHQLFNNFKTNTTKALRSLSQNTYSNYHPIMPALSSYFLILTTVLSLNTETPTAAFKMGVAYTRQLLWKSQSPETSTMQCEHTNHLILLLILLL